MTDHRSSLAHHLSFPESVPNVGVRSPVAIVWLLAVAILLVAATARAASPLVVSHADAFVSHDSATDVWTLGNNTITARFELGADHQLTLTQLLNPRTGRLWDITPGADTMIGLNGRSVPLAGGPTGLSFVGATAGRLRGGVHVAFTYRHNVLHARIVRHYACYPGSPTIETWTRLDVAERADPVTVSNLTGWQLTVPLGAVRWINGLRGDARDVPDEAFSLGHKHLGPDELLTLFAHRRSSEQFVPFVMIDGPTGGEWYGGVQWSGAWQIECLRQGSRLQVTLSYPEVTTTVSEGHPLEIPHSFFGVTPGGPTDVGITLRGFIHTAIRQGRPLLPLVTYNTWYAYGTRVDEATIMNEIDRTAPLGFELFVLDAGWYQGAGVDGPFDFESGLGNWTVDPDRFPNGLQPLVEFAHASGMKFGLWVEPGRVSLETVDQLGLAQDAWLATHDGRQVSATAGQICFASAAARQWVFDQLTRLIDSVRPDYLKWDNNMWLNCNRDGHDHGPDDGNLAQVQGLYTVLQALRDRYPNLLIENVSDGGSRIDFGWLRYSDATWMDDRTQPSAHVRHNLEGLSTVFPPAYLLSRS